MFDKIKPNLHSIYDLREEKNYNLPDMRIERIAVLGEAVICGNLGA